MFGHVRCIIGAPRCANLMWTDLEERLTAVFHQVRKVRNDAGHPTGHVPDEAEVHGNLILFAGYAELIQGLMDHLQVNPIP